MAKSGQTCNPVGFNFSNNVAAIIPLEPSMLRDPRFEISYSKAASSSNEIFCWCVDHKTQKSLCVKSVKHDGPVERNVFSFGGKFEIRNLKFPPKLKMFQKIWVVEI